MEKITNEGDYKEVMAKIDSLMAKGSNKVSKEELSEIHATQSAQEYEQAKYRIEAIF